MLWQIITLYLYLNMYLKVITLIYILRTYTLVLSSQCICYIAYTICAAFQSSVDCSLVTQLRLVLVRFSYHLHIVIMTFIVYSNLIFIWHTVSVCWRDASILVLSCHQRLSIDFICIYIFTLIYILSQFWYCNLMCENKQKTNKQIYIYIYLFIYFVHVQQSRVFYYLQFGRLKGFVSTKEIEDILKNLVI